MTNSIEDIAEDAQAYLAIGTNTTEQHPVIGMRIRQAVRQRGAKLIVADPRKIDLVDFAVLHLRHKPGTDIALVNGLMHIILDQGWEDKAFIKERTEGFEDFKAVVDQYTPERTSEITGVPIEDLETAAEILAHNKPASVLWAMGITQHTTGVGNVMSLANLQMLLGNMGVPGGGTNPLRGQNNVQGACDLGGLPNVYPGYQKVTEPALRDKFAAAWGLAPDDLSPDVGKTVTELMPMAAEGELEVLYILGEDPIMSDPDTSHIPIIFLSATYVTPEDKAFAMSLGAVRFLEKPVDTEDFLLTVAEVLTDHQVTLSPPMDKQQFLKGYTGRLEVKLGHKNAQIARNERLLETLPDSLKPAFEEMLLDNRKQREQIQYELDEINSRLERSLKDD